MEGYDTNVSLFPPAGTAWVTVMTPQGPSQQFVPAVEYPKVKDLSFDPAQGWVTFTTRAGDKITSTLPYIIKYVPLPPEA
jgi:hypothetical protein